MIARSDVLEQPPGWQAELASAFRDLHALLDYLGITPERVDVAPAAAQTFPCLVPRGFADRMHPGDADDPLLRQVLPVARELLEVPGFTTDPLAEADCQPVPGVLHKYRGRALLTLTGACAIHCRYCFRRHFPYAESNPRRDGWQQALAYLRQDTTIEEVILSGGDPLTCSDRLLGDLVSSLNEVASIKRLRIHTRLPVVLPSRVTPGLLRIFGEMSRPVVMVVHANHPNELSADVTATFHALRTAGVQLLNQSVLLAGVNDSPATLAELSSMLVAAGVMPYYLHQLDKVAGAAHFAVADDRARAIEAELRTLVPGYMVPRLVRENPAGAAKMPL